MSFDPDRRELRRALLERVAEAQLAFEQAREDLRRTMPSRSRSSIVRSAEEQPHDVATLALQSD